MLGALMKGSLDSPLPFAPCVELSENNDDDND